MLQKDRARASVWMLAKMFQAACRVRALTKITRYATDRDPRSNGIAKNFYEHCECHARIERKEREPMRLILLIILILLLVGALPTWPYSTGWGYYPSGGLVLLIILLLIFLR
jgi:hypothetical protein